LENHMESLAKRVDAVMVDCLYRPAEAPDGKPPVDAVIVKGIVRDFAFHPARLASHKADIAAMCDELPDTFHKSGGGGWSFLNLCMDKRGHQWGEQTDGEALVALAAGTEQGGFLMPRDMWSMFPGDMPYVWLGA
jgi:hypothetical protein